MKAYGKHMGEDGEEIQTNKEQVNVQMVGYDDLYTTEKDNVAAVFRDPKTRFHLGFFRLKPHRREGNITMQRQRPASKKQRDVFVFSFGP